MALRIQRKGTRSPITGHPSHPPAIGLPPFTQAAAKPPPMFPKRNVNCAAMPDYPHPMLHTRLLRLLSIFTLASLARVAGAEDFDFEKERASAAKGDAGVQFLIGRTYANSNGAPKDPAKAADFFRKAAEQGNAKAQNNLAWLYLNGNGVEKNPGEGLVPSFTNKVTTKDAKSAKEDEA